MKYGIISGRKLNGLLKPTGGRVLLDGFDVRSLTQRSLRNQIGMVQQDVYLFCGTIRENIAYGKPGASMEEIIDAAKKPT